MTKYVDRDYWEDSLLMPDKSTPVLGGNPVWDGDTMLEGFYNIPVAQLADRTRHLKDRVETVENNLHSGILRSENNLSDLSNILAARVNLNIADVDNTRDNVKSVASAGKLTSPVKINGTDFDGSTPITTSTWGVARNISIGGATKQVNGSQDISFRLEDIGFEGLELGTTSTTAKPGDWQPSSATKASVLAGVATTDFVTPKSYSSFITWNDLGSVKGTVTIPFGTSLNTKLSVTGTTTVGKPTGILPGMTGDLYIVNTGNFVVSWNTSWKFLSSVPNISKSGETWVVSYKVIDSSTIIAAAAKVV